ncbi:MAG: TonB-dependent receptor [Rudaea sp.]|uniref:TonB-dependent receptor domain-containing protein n=1 Tax=Rudaea sp. TaxID=2136325 RepID=UPI0039E5347C
MGAQFRHEAYSYLESDFGTSSITKSSFEPARKVYAGFVELRLPLIGEQKDTNGSAILEASLTDRYEHYSDFGDTNNPQFGLIYQPLPTLKFRGTAGTSFRAPLLSDLNPIPSQAVVLPLNDPASGSYSCFPFSNTSTCTNTVSVFGGNPNLGPEKARSWTVGFDWAPEGSTGFRAGGTYYNITFRDRIANPSGLITYLYALENETILGPKIVQRNPAIGIIQQISQTPGFINPFGINLATIDALVDYRENNLSVVKTSGIDLDLSWRFSTFGGDVEAGGTTTKIIKFENRFSSLTPLTSLLNTPFNPIDLKIRSRLIYSRGQISIGLYGNYVDSYSDNRSGLNIPVASWATFDANARYKWEGVFGGQGSATLMAGINNFTNRNPPFLYNPIFNVNFDGANANALGRMIYMQCSISW